MNKLANVIAGEIYAIPLFLSSEKDTKNFSRNKFEDKGKEFVFCRIIEDNGGGGILVEIFNLIGELSQDLNTIINSARIFQPIAISGVTIYKKRWKKIYTQKNYDKQKDSKYSEICLVSGDYDAPDLWRGGKDFGQISEIEADKYERWIIWKGSQLEKRIIKELFAN